MRTSEVFRHPIKTFRTAPLGCAVLAGQVYPLAANIVEPSAPSLIVESVVAAAGVLLTYRQLRLQKRMEEAFERHGFDERDVATTVHEWCARQTTLVTAEDFGFREQCEAFYDTRQRDMEYGFIPHF